ncbi:hypothetical protein B0J11DRAFT_583062 [Dendryphion nanum]|uniref:F-box domain-containing protein n=1 Tax=Dendryphion nanum TaxID=256645 RepID=A0A9P9DEF4_9PLEO|nr:hypothetical protein B0J11DRAFT_583062 [Dendryphion nanum]
MTSQDLTTNHVEVISFGLHPGLKKLPNEIVQAVFSSIRSKIDLGHVRLVCSDWNRLMLPDMWRKFEGDLCYHRGRDFSTILSSKDIIPNIRKLVIIPAFPSGKAIQKRNIKSLLARMKDNQLQSVCGFVDELDTTILLLRKSRLREISQIARAEYGTYWKDLEPILEGTSNCPLTKPLESLETLRVEIELDFIQFQSMTDTCFSSKRLLARAPNLRVLEIAMRWDEGDEAHIFQDIFAMVSMDPKSGIPLSPHLKLRELSLHYISLARCEPLLQRQDINQFGYLLSTVKDLQELHIRPGPKRTLPPACILSHHKTLRSLTLAFLYPPTGQESSVNRALKGNEEARLPDNIHSFPEIPSIFSQCIHLSHLTIRLLKTQFVLLNIDTQDEFLLHDIPGHPLTADLETLLDTIATMPHLRTLRLLMPSFDTHGSMETQGDTLHLPYPGQWATRIMKSHLDHFASETLRYLQDRGSKVRALALEPMGTML